MLEPPCLVPPLSLIHAHPSYVLFPVHYNIKINSFHVTQYGLLWTAIRWVTYSVMVPNNSFPCSQNPTTVQFWVKRQFNQVRIFTTYVFYKSLLDYWGVHSQAVISTKIYFLTKQQHAIFPSDQELQMLSITVKTTNTFLPFLVWKQYFKQVPHCYKNQV